MNNEKIPKVNPANLAENSSNVQSGVKSRGSTQKLDTKKIATIIALVIVITAILGFGYYKKQSENKLSDTNPTDYSFDDEQRDGFNQVHLLKGKEAQTGMGFNLPLNDIVYSDSPFDKADERLKVNHPNDLITNEGNSVILGQRIVTGSEGEASVHFQTLATALIVPKSQQEAFNLTEYFSQIISGYSFGTGVDDASKVVFGLNEPVAFANNQITKGAQIYQFNAFSKEPAENQALKKLTGYLVEVKGKNANYYMLLGAIESVWMSGTETWQNVINSLKVDQ